MYFSVGDLHKAEWGTADHLLEPPHVTSLLSLQISATFLGVAMTSCRNPVGFPFFFVGWRLTQTRQEGKSFRRGAMQTWKHLSHVSLLIFIVSELTRELTKSDRSITS